MITSDSRLPEMTALALAAGLLGVSAWVFRPGSVPGEGATVRTGPAASPWREEVAPRAVVAPAVWRKPAPQSSGPGWVYEVFTPPAVYYNRLARSFSVTPPGARGEGAAAFGLELLAVRRDLFRLQLSGYFGEPGNWLVAFTAPGSPATLLARPGRRFESLGLTLHGFEERKVEVARVAGRPVHEVVAFAVLRDERTGREVVLDSRAPAFTDASVALVRAAPGDARGAVEVREGDTVAGPGATYRIERIQADPPEVVVSRLEAGLPVPETVILRPVPGAAARREISSTPPSTEAVTRR